MVDMRKEGGMNNAGEDYETCQCQGCAFLARDRDGKRGKEQRSRIYVEGRRRQTRKEPPIIGWSDNNGWWDDDGKAARATWKAHPLNLGHGRCASLIWHSVTKKYLLLPIKLYYCTCCRIGTLPATAVFHQQVPPNGGLFVSFRAPQKRTVKLVRCVQSVTLECE